MGRQFCMMQVPLLRKSHKHVTVGRVVTEGVQGLGKTLAHVMEARDASHDQNNGKDEVNTTYSDRGVCIIGCGCAIS